MLVEAVAPEVEWQLTDPRPEPHRREDPQDRQIPTAAASQESRPRKSHTHRKCITIFLLLLPATFVLIREKR